MPSASDEVVAALHKAGCADDMDAMKLLRDHGYTCGSDFIWRKPTPEHLVSLDEAACLDYLFREWDYGFDDDGVFGSGEPKNPPEKMK